MSEPGFKSLEILIKNPNENNSLLNEEKNMQKKRRIILLTLIIITLIIIIFIIRENIPENNIKKNKNFKIIFPNEKIKKPLKTNKKYEIIKLKNNYTFILINNPNSLESGIEIKSKLGFQTDIIDGFSHFAEHIFFGGSKKNKGNKLKSLILSYNNIINANTEENFTLFEIFGPNFILNNLTYLISDFIQNPELNEKYIKSEIISIDSEFQFNNFSDNVLYDILINNCNYKHPFSQSETCHFGNRKSLNKISVKKLIKYLNDYFKILFNPENCIFSLYGSQSIEELKLLVLKYFNFNLEKPSLDFLNQINDKISLIKSEKIFNKDDLGKIAFVNTERESSLVEFFFEIPIESNYKNIFNIIQYLLNGNEDYSLKHYLLINNYAINIIYNSRILINSEIISIKIDLTDFGIENYYNIIEAIFAYINIIKNETNEELLNNIYQIHLMKFLQEEITYPNLPNEAEEIINNFNLYGAENMLGYPVKENYSLKSVKNYLNYMQSNNCFIIFDTPKNNIFSSLKDKKEKKTKSFNNIYYIYKIPEEKINILNKITQIDNYRFSIRKINNYYTKLNTLSKKPCYEMTPIICKYEEYNPKNNKTYLPFIIEKNKKIFSLMKIDRSFGLPIIKGFVKFNIENMNLNIDEINIFFYLFFDSFRYKVLNSYLNEGGTKIEIFDDYSPSIQISFSTYSDLLDKVSEFIINFMKEPINEKIFNYLKEKYLFEKSKNNEDPLIDIREEILNIFKKFIQVNIYFNDFFSIDSLIKFQYNNYTEYFFYLTKNVRKLIYLTHGDINYEQAKLNTKKLSQLIKKKEEIKLLQSSQINIPKKISILYSTKSEKKYEKQGATLIMYEIYKENLIKYFQIYVSCSRGKIFDYLRTDKSTGYHITIKIEEILGKHYLMIYVISPIYSPEKLDHLINEAINQSFNIKCHHINFINDYIVKRDNFKFSQDDIFQNLINLILNEEYENNLNQEKEFNLSYKMVIEKIKPLIIDFPKRIGILYHRGDITEKELNKEISDIDKFYYLNNEIVNEINNDINYLDKFKLNQNNYNNY